MGRLGLGRGAPLPNRLGGLGSIVSSPSRVRGGARPPTLFLAYFRPTTLLVRRNKASFFRKNSLNQRLGDMVPWPPLWLRPGRFTMAIGTLYYYCCCYCYYFIPSGVKIQNVKTKLTVNERLKSSSSSSSSSSSCAYCCSMPSPLFDDTGRSAVYRRVETNLVSKDNSLAYS